jgi:predicted negative regulator of RcsB-dependent stress response
LDRQTRHNLKTDKFAEEVFDVFEWTSAHKAEMIRYGGILLAVVVIGLGVLFYNRSQAGQREEALAKALRIDDATVGAAEPQGGGLHYSTEEEKTKARALAFADIAKNSGTQEGAIAELYLAGSDVDAGNLADAEKRFKRVAEDAPKAYASLAKLALAQVYAAQGKPADAEKLLRELMDHPTATVSKEQATLVLGQMLAASKPDEAHKLLDPLRTSTRSSISHAAVTAVGSIPKTGK